MIGKALSKTRALKQITQSAIVNGQLTRGYVPPPTGKPSKNFTIQREETAWADIPNPYIDDAPEDVFEPQHLDSKKKITLTVSNQSYWVVKFEKVMEIEMVTFDEGRLGILPCHADGVYRLEPHVMKVKYNEERVDRWWIAGGLGFVYWFGPVHITGFAAFKLEELDPELIQKELDICKEKMRTPNPDLRDFHQVGVTCYERMLEGFKEMEAESL